MGIDSTKYNLDVKTQGALDTEYVGVGCHLSFENLMHKGTRDLAGNNCKLIPVDGAVDDNGKRLKAKKFDNGSITYVYSPISTDGRKKLNDAYDDEVNDVKLTIRLSLNDKGAGSSPTYVERDILVTSIEPIDDDDEFVEKVTVEFLNAPRTTERVA